MFVLGHIGVGRALVGARGRALPIAAFAIGAVLPDIIDKPLYYSHVSPFFSCTRTLGHTGLFLGLLVAVAAVTRSRVWMALAVAVATHLLLDGVMDLQSDSPSSTVIAVTWPFLSTGFAHYDFDSPLDQLSRMWRPDIVATETIGLALLAWEYWRRRR